MASMNHRQYTPHKYHANYNDYEGLEYDEYDEYDKEYSLNHNQKDECSGYDDMPGRVKSKKQARKFARHGK